MIASARRAAGRALAALALALASAAAHAQDEFPNVISPLRVESDQNGVNLVSGTTEIQLPVLSAPAAPNLRFDRVQNAAPYAAGRSQGGGIDGGINVNYSVHTGTGSSESFRCIGGTCTSITGTGSWFGGNSYIQAGTGARWNFHTKSHDTTLTDPAGSSLRYLTSIIYPNGERINYSYNSVLHNGITYYRPVAMTSTTGYFIYIHYQGDTFGTNEWSTVRQASLYREGEASPDVLVRRFVYTANSVIDYGNNVDDIGGRTYNCSGCLNQLGGDLEVGAGSLLLPGDGTAAVQATQSTQAGVQSLRPIVGSVARDGVQWNYSYANLRPTNSIEGYWYDSVTVTGPEGYRNVYAMHISGGRNVLTSITDSLDRVTTYEHDGAYRPWRITYPEGNRVSVAYDEYGNIISRTLTPKVGSGDTAITETANYDITGCVEVMCYRPSFSIDARGYRTDYTYNANGQLTERTDPEDQFQVRRRTIISYATSPAGISRRSVVRVCGTGAACGTSAEIRTEYTYWGDTNLVARERRVSGATVLDTLYTYDDAGNVLTVNGPVGGTDDTTYYEYDPFGRRTWEIGPLGRTGPDGATLLRSAQVHIYRNSDDKVTRTRSGSLPDHLSRSLTQHRRVDYVYDSRRNLVRETGRGAGSSIVTLLQRTFDLRNRLECEARRMNPAVFGTPPASACDLGAQGTAPDYGPDRISRNVYDAAGQLLQVQRAYRITTANGFPQTYEQNYASYAYSLNGQHTRVTDANGNRAEMRYDGHDRQVRWVFPSPTTDYQVNEADYEAYGYDSAGNRTSLRRRDNVTLTYQYDRLNRMIVKLVPNRTGLGTTHTRNVYYGYDVLDNTTYARFDSAAGQGVTNDYDGFGRLTSSMIDLDGTPRTLGHIYDSGSRRTRLTWPTGIAVNYGWDPASRLQAVYHGTGTAGPISEFSYTARGLVDVRSDGLAAGASVNHGHDTMGRLWSQAFAFADAAGNLTATLAYNPASQIITHTRSNDAYIADTAYNVGRNYDTNGLNQYTRTRSGTTVTATFDYDLNGNLLGDGSSSYKYDNENRLVSATVGGATATLRYDPLGRLFEVSSPSGTTEFLWDGDALVGEYDSAGTLTERYVHGPAAGADDPLVWYRDTNRRRLHADHQGSIVAVSGSTGALMAANAYDAWGIPNSGNLGRFGYTGQIWIPELGLWHYKARMYSPTLGRFMQTDPIGYEDQMNLYAYVGNDPVNRVDPTGTTCTSSQNNGRTVYSCRIDKIMRNGREINRSSLTRNHQRQIRNFERQYTAAVTSLMEQNRPVNVSAMAGYEGSGFQLSSHEVGTELIGRQFNYRTDETRGNALMGTSGRLAAGNVVTDIYSNGIRSNHRDIAHEGIHKSRAEIDRNPFASRLHLSPFQELHQEPYERAVRELLGEHD